jgi:hypothetical protein
MVMTLEHLEKVQVAVDACNHSIEILLWTDILFDEKSSVSSGYGRRTLYNLL